MGKLSSTFRSDFCLNHLFSYSHSEDPRHLIPSFDFFTGFWYLIIHCFKMGGMNGQEEETSTLKDEIVHQFKIISEDLTQKIEVVAERVTGLNET